MKYNVFDTELGRSVVAQRVSDKQFVYVKPSTLDAHPEEYIPYDFCIRDRQTVATQIGSILVQKEHFYREPTEPTKQELEG
jgi:hypothetical protein